jgi:hypothetical protein
VTPAELAAATLRLEPPLQAALCRDLLDEPDLTQTERVRLGAAVLALLMRRYLASVPVDPTGYLEAIVRAALTP